MTHDRDDEAREHRHEQPERSDRGYQEVSPRAWESVREALLAREQREEERRERRRALQAARRARREKKLREQEEEER